MLRRATFNSRSVFPVFTSAELTTRPHQRRYVASTQSHPLSEEEAKSASSESEPAADPETPRPSPMPTVTWAQRQRAKAAAKPVFAKSPKTSPLFERPEPPVEEFSRANEVTKGSVSESDETKRQREANENISSALDELRDVRSQVWEHLLTGYFTWLYHSVYIFFPLGAMYLIVYQPQHREWKLRLDWV